MVPITLLMTGTSDVFVLIVDDDESMRATLQEFIGRMGVRTQVAEDVQGAERLLKTMPVAADIVLTDLRLPDGSGLDVVKAARTRSSTALVSIITGYASLETAIEAIRLGAHDYITKPFSLDEIGIHVRNMIERVYLSRENARLSLRLQELLGDVSRLQSERAEFLRLLEGIRGQVESNTRKLDALLDQRITAAGSGSTTGAVLETVPTSMQFPPAEQLAPPQSRAYMPVLPEEASSSAANRQQLKKRA